MALAVSEPAGGVIRAKLAVISPPASIARPVFGSVLRSATDAVPESNEPPVVTAAIGANLKPGIRPSATSTFAVAPLLVGDDAWARQVSMSVQPTAMSRTTPGDALGANCK